MKLVYERTYKTIDKNMSDAQVGARKKKSVRNHLFVLNAILADVVSSKTKEPPHQTKFSIYLTMLNLSMVTQEQYNKL